MNHFLSYFLGCVGEEGAGSSAEVVGVFFLLRALKMDLLKLPFLTPRSIFTSRAPFGSSKVTRFVPRSAGLTELEVKGELLL